jgi:hypothetical protein
VEVDPKDPYYKFLKRAGAMDYIDDILAPGEETGMRVDMDFIYAPTVCVVKRIDAYNINNVLKSIGYNNH